MKIAMSRLLRFPSSVERDPAIEVWMHDHSDALGTIAQRWFAVMRECGADVRELLHDGHPTACAGDAAFAYVNAFKGHVNVGFFRGAEIADPERLLEGTGKFMRHVKLRPEHDVDAKALKKLIDTAYTDMKRRVEAEGQETIIKRQSEGSMVPRKIEVQNVVRPGSKRFVDARMYAAMKVAVLKHTPKRLPGATLAELRSKVEKDLPHDLYPDGAKAGWWFKTVQLDLEAMGRLVRTKSSPLRLVREDSECHRGREG